ncbi:stealth conserved region 3 domain-containing protein [Nocardiopsis quinghaiensis]|uniref:stealth conserved region 3 domain-containing protein n=1 Tax=Nocardiopsis quinghaiensis TaxID=464995 RepID=UPI001CC234D6|nr:stealth conserved region 3 domain-containing protein [Nocardiopsis quinghaiensis]
MANPSNLSLRIRTAARRRIPAPIRTRLLRATAEKHLRNRPDLRISVYQQKSVLARLWEGPFSVASLTASQVERFTTLLRNEGVDYFISRSNHPYHHSIGVGADQRDKVLRIIESSYVDHGFYIKQRRSYLLLTEGLLEKNRESDVLRLGEYVVGERGTAVTGPAHGFSIEFWQEGSTLLASPGHGEERLKELRVVTPEETLRESLVGPQLNPVSEVLPPEARKPATTTIGDATHPTLEAFTWDLATDISFPIDVVYTWVDGDDPRWSAKRAEHMGVAAPLNPDSASASRYTSRDELRYSLRSLEMFAPFVRNIYIVTDEQCPEWLRSDHPRVRVVDHKEIFSDPSLLPVFNSHAIESQLHHIEGLSEHYLYLNDDVLFGRPLSAAKFFHPNGIARLNPSTYRFGLSPVSLADQPVDAAAKRNSALIREKFGKLPTTKFKHTPIAQRRSVLHELEEEFPDVFAKTAASRFRHPDDYAIPSSLHNYYAMLTGRAVFGSLRYTYLNLANLAAVRERTHELLTHHNYDSLCVNDTTPPDDDTSARHIDQFFRDFLPFKSSFER